MATLTPWLAAAVSHARHAAGISQEELADRARLDRTYISLVERSKRNITVDALDRIARGLGVPASHLIADAERARARGRRPSGSD